MFQGARTCMFTTLTHSEICLVLGRHLLQSGSLEAEPETRVHVQGIYKAGLPGKTKRAAEVGRK